MRDATRRDTKEHVLHQDGVPHCIGQLKVANNHPKLSVHGLDVCAQPHLDLDTHRERERETQRDGERETEPPTLMHTQAHMRHTERRREKETEPPTLMHTQAYTRAFAYIHTNTKHT
jgi:hypothetical protein